jgi:hypothetical protein
MNERNDSVPSSNSQSANVCTDVWVQASGSLCINYHFEWIQILVQCAEVVIF